MILRKFILVQDQTDQVKVMLKVRVNKVLRWLNSRRIKLTRFLWVTVAVKKSNMYKSLKREESQWKSILLVLIFQKSNNSARIGFLRETTIIRIWAITRLLKLIQVLTKKTYRLNNTHLVKVKKDSA